MVVLFETTESVIELLWDIALAFFIVRLALTYFLLTFLSGLILSYISATQLPLILPYLPFSRYLPLETSTTELLITPLLFLMAAFWSRFLIAHYEIPRVATFRLGIGAVAMFMVVAAEVLTGVLLVEEGHGDWIWETDAFAGGALAVLVVTYGLMPWGMMFFEHPDQWEEIRVKGTHHGHEGKSIVDAVPTVRPRAREVEDKKKQ